MKIYHNINDFKPVPNPIVTVGTFDGVHLGHQAILKKMIDEARKIGGETVVLTFYPHPRQVLHGDNSLRITSQEKKIELLDQLGIDNLIVINFTKEFSRTTSEQFIKKYIIEGIHPVKLIVGYDHHFGKNRMGDYNLLFDLSTQYNFKLEHIPARNVENIAVSSTKIRNALTQGNVGRANSLLGYQYTIYGNVSHGNGLGRTFGFPTANIEIPDEYKLIAARGVYACFVDYKGIAYQGMANIGLRPTISDYGVLLVEVNIFDFDQDIYGETIGIRFVERLRDEKKFDSKELLISQLIDDRKQAKTILEQQK
ncbi:MAG: bifunctional riboflavin kinase/FAD synthetase [Lentimicrobiaceae bacterium]|jgi:riboflavin kinase/FMN adenylyltransferase|nr:bifunctional riboflavin kinase/FAD synthetase [Lentimicrobiaceae bacterium]